MKLLEDVQRRFLKRLSWRCGNQATEELRGIKDLLVDGDRRFLKGLYKANLLQRFFIVERNDLRGGYSIRTKNIAKTQYVNNLYSWRMVRRVNDGDDRVRELLVFLVNTPTSLLYR